ncbi:MAG TPA: hypothetical protein VGS57_04430 [Thermoanaerobaculia bacterium]|jgi:hypothetical protein|nr:hypothetical protein [Thermoanaerobaculia bacterium]
MRLSLLRWPVAAGALLLLASTISQCRGEKTARAAAIAQWESTGAAAKFATQADRARRDPDPKASGPALARVLVNDAFDTRTLAALPPREAAAEARRVEERVRLAGDISSRTLAARPASWESAMMFGGARLLTAWRGGGELYAHPAVWRAPLEHAQRLAPGSPEPRKLLVTGYLATWQALSPSERDEGRRLVREAFRDRDTLAQLLPAWAAVAGSREELEAVLPAEPGPYEQLQQAAAGRGDWVGFCAARERWLPLTLAALQARLSEAERRLEHGDVPGGRTELIGTLSDAPPDRRTASLFSSAVEQLPPGQVGSATGPLSAWLAWALPLWELGKEPLPPEVLARVASLSPELPPPHAAMAALAGGDLTRAESWERRADRLWSEEWAPYAIAKAEALLARGDVEDAGTVLAEVHRSYQNRWAYLRARERLAGARSEGMVARPESLAAAAWGPEQWIYRGGEAAAELVAAHPARGVAVRVDVAPDAGAVVELGWDGLGMGCFPVRAGEPLRLPVGVASGPHRLTWRGLAGGRTAPGAVALLGTGGA